jgi:hypothetical protein
MLPDAAASALPSVVVASGSAAAAGTSVASTGLAGSGVLEPQPTTLDTPSAASVAAMTLNDSF